MERTEIIQNSYRRVCYLSTTSSYCHFHNAIYAGNTIYIPQASLMFFVSIVMEYSYPLFINKQWSLLKYLYSQNNTRIQRNVLFRRGMTISAYLNFGIGIKLYKSSSVRNRRHNDAGSSKSYVRALSTRVSSRAYNSAIKFAISVDLLRATDYAT